MSIIFNADNGQSDDFAVQRALNKNTCSFGAIVLKQRAFALNNDINQKFL